MAFVEVEVELSDFDDDELLEEIAERGINISIAVPEGEGSETHQLITTIWLKRRLGVDYDADIDKLIYHVIGKVI
jgi:hypothetical protein